MRINKALRYLHIAIPRTASSTVSYYLSREANPEPKDHHMPLSKALVTHPYAQDYFKFTFVRHPLDRLVSLYHEFKFNRVHEYSAMVRVERPLLSEFNDFRELCLGLPDSNWVHDIFFQPQTWFTHIDGVNGMDFVGRFENLHSDIAKVTKKLSIPHQQILKIRPSVHANYMSYYNQEAIDSIMPLYRTDFEEFGYEV